MFTGIVESIGTFTRPERTPDGLRFAIASPDVAPRVAPGDSVSVSGVCQTVESIAGDEMTFTAVGETLERTTLGGLTSGELVNLELAATLQTALGGHLVQGHVDGVATVTAFEQVGEDRLLSIELPPELAVYAVPKGSITVSGISLTIVEVGDNTVSITIIPHTLQCTTLGKVRAGDRVNIEVDIIGKYVKHFMTSMQDG